MQGHWVQHSKWSLSMANSYIWAFLLALNVFEIFTFQNSRPIKYRSRSRCATFAVAPFDGKCLTSHLMATVMFVIFLALTCVNSHFKSCSFENLGRGQLVEFLQWRHGKRQIYKRHFLYFWCAHESNIHTDIDRERMRERERERGREREKESERNKNEQAHSSRRICRFV